jgi:hypothetical protein
MIMLVIFAVSYVAGTLATLLLIGVLRVAKQSAITEDAPRAMSR